MSDSSGRTTIVAGASRGFDPGSVAGRPRAPRGDRAALLAAAGLAWWWTVERMAGMDAGPGGRLGTLGWFTGSWARDDGGDDAAVVRTDGRRLRGAGAS